uniref:UDP-glycosyltransferase 91A1 n=1 Tax=Vitis vinifera TaxID=29760 RepID=F6I725_VITVI|eukprot:XP_002270260.1 PREDICTED: UDP-glycosyltransferase 91A1 [Vitis vinifera]
MDSQALRSKQDDAKLHIVLFPWLAFGHMIPYLELAKLVAQRGHHVSFVSTPRNIDRLPKLPPNLTPFISFVKIPLPHVPNLPENAEATTDLPENKVQFLKQAYNLLEEGITGFLDAAAPDWVLHDFTAYWLVPIATKLGIACGFLSIFTASVLCFFNPSGQDHRTEPEDFTVAPKWVPFPSRVAFRYFEVVKIFNNAIAGDASGTSDMHRFEACIRGCDLLAVRSCTELEPEWLRLLEQLYQKPVVPVGQLPPILPNGGDDDEDETWLEIKCWLDKQAGGSVVYVAFGSEAKPNQTELTEIALGLEQSELPFFWALKLKRGPCDTEVIQLPEGFKERTKGRGVVCTSWAPQLKILSHPSICGFLSHSGWTSVVEALQLERPLILLTFLADQGLNASFLREKKMGCLIPRNEEDGSFTREAVAQSLRLVVVEEGGKIYRDKAKEMRGVFGDRDRQNQYVDTLVSCLKEHRHIHKAKACAD